MNLKLIGLDVCTGETVDLLGKWELTGRMTTEDAGIG